MFTMDAQLEAVVFPRQAKAEVGASPELLVETESMVVVAVGLNRGAGDNMYQASTIATEIMAHILTDLQADLTETAMTATVHTIKKNPTWFNFVLPTTVFV